MDDLNLAKQLEKRVKQLQKQNAEQHTRIQELLALIDGDGTAILVTSIVGQMAADRGRSHRVLGCMPQFKKIEIDRHRSLFVAQQTDDFEVLDDLHLRLSSCKALPVVAVSRNRLYVMGLDEMHIFDIQEEEQQPEDLTDSEECDDAQDNRDLRLLDDQRQAVAAGPAKSPANTKKIRKKPKAK